MSDGYGDEARARWGDTEAYRQSEQRLARYTDGDIELAKKQAAAAVDMFAEAMVAGLPPESLEAAAAAEAHRKAITDWWYDCSYDMQANLAAMYLADSRFRAHYDDVEPGLAQYVHDAIVANAIARS